MQAYLSKNSAVTSEFAARLHAGWMFRVVTGLCFLCLTSVSQAQWTMDLASARFAARGVVTGYFADGGRRPALLIKTDRVYSSHERKGFFRIGVLPNVVADGITFEIYDPDSLAKVLGDSDRTTGAAKRLEIKNVAFVVCAGITNRLEGKRAQCVGDGAWEISGGVRLLSGTNQVWASRAKLQVSGPTAGTLVMEGPTPSSHQFFAASPPPPTPNQEEPP